MLYLIGREKFFTYCLAGEKKKRKEMKEMKFSENLEKSLEQVYVNAFNWIFSVINWNVFRSYNFMFLFDF